MSERTKEDLENEWFKKQRGGGKKELTHNELINKYGVKDNARLDIPMTDRYAWRHIAEGLRGLANTLEFLSKDQELTDLIAAMRAYRAARATAEEMKAELLSNKIARDLSKEEAAKRNIVSISGGR